MVPSSVVAPRNLADAIPAPRSLPRPLVDALWIVAASVFVAACARISFQLPFTPVPITGQTFAVLLTGITLGTRRGFLALALYLLEGWMGLPVFAGGTAGGAILVGKTAGYLWSYPVAAAFVGWLAGKGWDHRPLTAAGAMSLGSLIILTTGALWLSLFVGGLLPALMLGVVPFLPGDVVKLTLAAGLFPSAWAIVRRTER
jgi:biotin transport system substrate-specific component